MSFVIISQSIETIRTVYGNQVPSISFLGVVTHTTRTRIGVGILFPRRGNAYFWGPLNDTTYPHKLIELWRAWKILERVLHIGDTTLCACLASGRSTISPHDQAYIDTLFAQHDGYYVDTLFTQHGGYLEKHRELVLASLPTVDDLTAMVAVLEGESICYSAREIVRAYNALGTRLPKRLMDRAHREPAETLRELCTQIAYKLFQ